MQPFGELPLGFSPILKDQHGKIVMAVRIQPRAVLLPGPIGELDEDGERLWKTLLFNSLRWVLRDERKSISADFFSPSGEVVDDAFLESDTAEPVRSIGSINDIKPLQRTIEKSDLWPWFIMVAALLFALERLVGVRWHWSGP